MRDDKHLNSEAWFDFIICIYTLYMYTIMWMYSYMYVCM